jgi:hypothetical protein
MLRVRVVTPITNVLTKSKQEVSGHACCRNIESSNSSNKVRNAKSAAGHTPGSAIRSITRHKTRTSSNVKNYSGALVLLLAICLPERSICCRARKTVRSPAAISDDTVHSRKATLRGSMRRADQKVSSPIRCCLA